MEKYAMQKIEAATATVGEFIKVISQIEGENNLDLWFRGQPVAEWGLVPKLYREPQATFTAHKKVKQRDVARKSREEDDETREQFIIRAASLADSRPSDKWGWYFVMQHHNAPTRLLDWTEGSLIGLYFAVRDNAGCHDAAVWGIDPWRLNKSKSVVNKNEVIPPGDPGITPEDQRRYGRWLHAQFARRKRWPQFPVAIYPGHLMRRIGVQRSCFTIHGWDRRGIERIAAELRVPFVKIVIPSWAVRDIRECLETSGIDETTMFPDLDGLGRSFCIQNTDYRPHKNVFVRLGPSKTHKGGIGAFAIRSVTKDTELFRGDNTEIVWIEEGRVPAGPPAIRKLYNDFGVKKKHPDGKTRFGCPPSFNRLTPSWFLNHSSKPNVRIDENFNFFALKDIPLGQELLVDYSTYSENEQEKHAKASRLKSS